MPEPNLSILACAQMEITESLIKECDVCTVRLLCL